MCLFKRVILNERNPVVMLADFEIVIKRSHVLKNNFANSQHLIET